MDSDIYKEITSNNKIIDLSPFSPFIVEVEMENRVMPSEDIPKGKGEKHIDILIKIYKQDKNSKDKALSYVFGVENKIKARASSGQLIGEIKGLINELKKDKSSMNAKPPKIGFIFLTPDNSPMYNNDFKELDKFLQENYSNKIHATHLIWKPQDQEKKTEKSVFSILSELLNQESKGLIEPIHEYSKYTLKALMNFILSDFKSYLEEKSEKRERTLLPPSEYNNFITVMRRKYKGDNGIVDLMDKIHCSIIDEYNCSNKFRIAPDKKRIAYFISNYKKDREKFLHVEICNKKELEFYFKGKGDEPSKPENSYYKSTNRNVYFCKISDWDKYLKVKDCIKYSFNLTKTTIGKS